MIYREQISNKLSALSIEAIAKSNKFTRRIGGKITPMNFVLSFFLSIQLKRHNFGTWAEQLSILNRCPISYNGIKKGLNKARVKFAKALLKAALADQLQSGFLHLKSTRLLEGFNEVYVEDSTCIKLPKCLYRFFPGAHSKTGKSATAKIQLRLELKKDIYSEISLNHYRQNDQSYAAQILQVLQAGDLLIRDLGYFSLKVFKQIINRKAFFISRLRPNVNLYDPKNKTQFDLAKHLRSARRNGHSSVELKLLAGKEELLPVRICAIKCPAKVTRQRRAKAKKNRNQKSNHSKEYFELLGWTIFITNVDQDLLKTEHLLEIYGYRWRIEIIFKTWKSHFNLERIFQTHAKLTEHQVQISIYLFLVWITLFFVRLYHYYFSLIYQKQGKILSMMKFAKFVKEHFSQFLLNPESDFWVNHIAYYCCYKKRKDKPNFSEQIYLLN